MDLRKRASGVCPRRLAREAWRAAWERRATDRQRQPSVARCERTLILNLEVFFSSRIALLFRCCTWRLGNVAGGLCTSTQPSYGWLKLTLKYCKCKKHIKVYSSALHSVALRTNMEQKMYRLTCRQLVTSRDPETVFSQARLNEVAV